MIQVIPFTADMEPSYLALLSRGLSDLSVLRFTTAQIEAQVNLGLKLNQWPTPALELNPAELREVNELWLAGVVKYDQGLIMEWVLYDPRQEQTVYFDRFAATEEKFMEAWTGHLNQLITALSAAETGVAELKPVTQSLQAFLEFRKGLELLAQAKTSRMKEQGLEGLLNAVAYDLDFEEAADIIVMYVLQNNRPDDFEANRKVLERLQQLLENYPRAGLVMAELYTQMQNQAQTEQTLQRVILQFPDFAEGFIRLALHYHSYQQFDEALVTLEALLAKEPDNIVGLDLLGAIYAGGGEAERAKEVWLKVLQLDGGRVNVLNNLGLLSEENGDPRQAEIYYQQAIAANDEWWGSFYNYGSFCRRQGRLNEAVGWLEKAGVLNPHQFQIFYFWGMTLFDLGRFEDAQEVILHLLKIAPDNQIRQQSLEVLNRFNQPEIKQGLKLSRLEKKWPELGLGELLAGLCKLEKSARNNWRYWYLWGCALEKLKLRWIALLVWRSGLKYGPGFALLKGLGLHYWRNHQYDKALPFFEQAYRLNHNDYELMQAYLATLNQLGQNSGEDLPGKAGSGSIGVNAQPTKRRSV